MIHRFARPLLALSAAVAAGLLMAPVARSQDAKAAGRPIKALLVTGGGYHDYKAQRDILTELDYIGRVLAPHKNGTPGIVVHCAMHTFRDLKSDEWREFLGVSTFRHGIQHPLDVKVVQPEHPIMKGFPSGWITAKEELYRIEKVWPGTTVLAEAKAEDGDKKVSAVMWAHDYGKAKVFGTTIAHNNKTMADGVYLDLFTRGVLWATDKIEADGKPKPGYGPVTTAKAE